MSEDQAETVDEMFVQLASGVTSTPETLTLHGITPSTLCFSDRPERVVGHLTTQQFVDDWGLGPDSFESDPSNVVLNFPDADGALADIVVELSSPRLRDGALSYSVKMLEGSLPPAAGACTLFVDPLGRPLSPVSVRSSAGASTHASPNDLSPRTTRPPPWPTYRSRPMASTPPDLTPAAAGPALLAAAASAVFHLQARYPTAPPALVQTCVNVAVDRLRDARIANYLPILIERCACEALLESDRSQGREA